MVRRVSIHAPAWGATSFFVVPCDIAASNAVSIHAPAWGATWNVMSRDGFNHAFQSTPPRGGRPQPSSPCPPRSRPSYRSFNPRPRVGGDVHALTLAQVTGGPRVFNPRPRVGGDPVCCTDSPQRGPMDPSHVSIHAPAWGATGPIYDVVQEAGCSFQSTRPRVGGDSRCDLYVAPSRGTRSFNPRPRVGATRPMSVSLRRPSSFNPRPRVGGDHRCRRRPADACFNPRPRVGGDRCNWICTPRVLFQSTPPRGGDSGRPEEPRGHEHLVSIHAPAGGRHDHGCAPMPAETCLEVSIHAPAWGATPDPPATELAIISTSFNPRPRVGGDERRDSMRQCRTGLDGASVWGFNPRPPRGGRPRPRPRWGALRQPRRRRERFNPRPRVGGDPPIVRRPRRPRGFNPRPRVGGDRLRALRGGDRVSIHAPAWGATADRRGDRPGFQSTPPRGGDQRRRGWFQSTPPRGGRLPFGCLARSFNPRPRVGGDGDLHDPMVVSIHAPAWGATPAAVEGARFQSTPPRGATADGDESPGTSFNPRPRVGGDSAGHATVVAAGPVSIHAPAWGATRRARASRHRFGRFQSTPPRGGRPAGRRTDRVPRVSIHAPAWGRRATGVTASVPLRGFNPRPRVGGDRNRPMRRPAVIKVSIHAPAWGATPGARRRRRRPGVSIHAPAWGATLATYEWRTIGEFQSTPPRGGRDVPAGMPSSLRVSIHAPAWGATPPL